MDVGEKLGKYEIRGTLGRGAMGVVYDGWDPLIERRVAIKTVRLPNEEDTEAGQGLARFRREAQAAGRLQHPNIVAVYDYGETGDIAYLVMEFVDGRSLKSALDADERFPVAELVRVMQQLLQALQYSHDHGVVHRDIKPANIMLTRAGQVKVADFGVARIESSSMTQVGTVLGTPAYMSPEQLAGQTVDLRSDIYSAGVVLYQLLTGDRPYHGSNLTSIYHQALNSEPIPPSKLAVTVPPAFDPVVARAMAKRPQERFASSDEFAAAIRAAGEEQAPLMAAEPDATIVSSAPASAPAPAPRPNAVAVPPAGSLPSRGGGNRTVALAASAGMALLLAGGGAWYLTRPAPLGDTKLAKVEPTAMRTPAAAHPAATAGGSTREAPAPVPREPANTASPMTSAVTPIAAPETQPVAPRPRSPAPIPTRVTEAPVPPRPAPRIETPPVRAPAKYAESAPPAIPRQEGNGQPHPVSVPPTPPPRAPVAARPTTTSVPAPPTTIAESAPTKLALAPVALRSAIAAAVAPVGCTLVGGDVASRGGDVLLTGVAGRGGPSASLHRAVTEAAPTAAVDWRVASFDGPYCPALDVLRPVAAGFAVSGAGFKMALRNGERALTDGQLITIDLRMPDYPAWLLVDYLQHDGTVVHLFPTAKEPARRFAANSHQSVGDPAAGGERWEVGAPYGSDMIIAVTSSAPLFKQKRQDLEQTGPYLRSLQAAIEAARARNVRLSASAVVLTTKPRL